MNKQVSLIYVRTCSNIEVQLDYLRSLNVFHFYKGKKLMNQRRKRKEKEESDKDERAHCDLRIDSVNVQYITLPPIYLVSFHRVLCGKKKEGGRKKADIDIDTVYGIQVDKKREGKRKRKRNKES